MRWRILGKLKVKNSKLKIEEIIKVLLENRGLITKKQKEEFLKPPNPYTLRANQLGISQREVDKTIARIKKAIKEKEKIIVYGDYDTDGVCGTAILWQTLYDLGANVMPFIPKREEGYGLKVERLEEMAKNKVALIITVDQGIVALKQAERAKKLGIDLIISDHHLPGEKKPKAYALIHTTQLSGCGVAWFLAKELGNKKHLDLATIGTVADVVPLLGPNRAIVKFGLEELRKTKNLGLLKLLETAGLIKEKINTYEIGFIIGPRLNASGRMDDPMDSLRLLCTKDIGRASVLAKELDEKNRQRQELMEEFTAHARELWLKEDGKSNLIFVSHESYQEGIVGLVAGKLMEEFYRPAVVISKGKEFSKASARSIEEFNIIEAVRACADLLGPHGGHPKAAGFTIETAKIEQLKVRLLKIADEKLRKIDLNPTLKIDTELNLEDLTLAFYKKIAPFAPYGEANPQPVFATRGVKVVDARLVGSDSRHLVLRFQIPNSKFQIQGVGFNMSGLFSKLSPEKPIDIAYSLILDEWNGEKRLKLKIEDIKIK